MSRGRRGASGSPPVLLDLTIESLDHEGRGIARHDGKVIFVEGALSGERVLAVSHRRKPAYEEASVHSVIHESASRVRPRCRHFGTSAAEVFSLGVRMLQSEIQKADRPWDVVSKLPVLEGKKLGTNAAGIRFHDGDYDAAVEVMDAMHVVSFAAVARWALRIMYRDYGNRGEQP